MPTQSRRICSLLSLPAIVVALLCTLTSPELRAEKTELARSYFRIGQAYYQQGRYREAIKQFEQAYRLSERAALLYNIGQAHERLGELGQAVSYYERYLRDSGKKDSDLSAKVDNLRQRLASTGIRVLGGVKGATVKVDGRVVGRLPLAKPISLPAGSHKVEVSKRGYQSFSAFVSVNPGSVLDVQAEMKAMAVPRPRPRPVAPVSPAPVVDSNQPSSGRLWTWIALGTGGALLAAGAVTGVVAMKKADGAESGAKGLGVTADVLIGVGAAAAITGAVLFFLEDGGGESEQRQAVIAPSISNTSAGVQAAFRF